MCKWVQQTVRYQFSSLLEIQGEQLLLPDHLAEDQDADGSLPSLHQDF
jgi:hypothetical protein